MREIQWLDAHTLDRAGIRLYHYSLLFPKQVAEKVQYYATQPWGEYSAGVVRWAQDNYLAPIRRPFQAHNVHNYAGWLSKFQGRHPETIQNLRADLNRGIVTVVCRNNEDVEQLLDTYLSSAALAGR